MMIRVSTSTKSFFMYLGSSSSNLNLNDHTNMHNRRLECQNRVIIYAKKWQELEQAPIMLENGENRKIGTWWRPIH